LQRRRDIKAVWLGACEKILKKDMFVFRANDEPCLIYLILLGSMHVINEDFWRNCSIIETMKAHTIFGEVYILSSTEKRLASVIFAENSIILEVDSVCLFETCSRGHA